MTLLLLGPTCSVGPTLEVDAVTTRSNVCLNPCTGSSILNFRDSNDILQAPTLRPALLKIPQNGSHCKSQKSHICTFVQIYFAYSSEIWDKARGKGHLVHDFKQP